jgi:hypothetical protein
MERPSRSRLTATRILPSRTSSRALLRSLGFLFLRLPRRVKHTLQDFVPPLVILIVRKVRVMVSHPLEGVRIKINRAKKHLSDLVSEIEPFRQSNACEVVIQTDPDTGDDSYRVKVNNPIPSDWAGCIGDIVHSLRTAYDHLAVALVVANGYTSRTAIEDTQFPVGSSRDSFRTEKIRRAPKGAIEAIKRLEPYKGGKGHAIWEIHQLDILDKHRVLIPVGMLYKSVIIQISMTHLWDTDETVVPAF